MQNRAKLYSLLMFLFAEALIFVSIFYFLRDLSSQLQALYILVFSIVNYLIFFRIVDSISLFSENQSHGVASKGIIWFFKLLYVSFSISFLFILTFASQASVITQYIVQLIFLFLFLITQLLGLFSGNNATEVELREADVLSTKLELQKIFNNIEISFPRLSNSAELTQIKFTLKTLASDITYFSPSNDVYAKQLDQQLINLASEIQLMINNSSESYEVVKSKIQEFRGVFNSRKSIYSN